MDALLGSPLPPTGSLLVVDEPANIIWRVVFIQTAKSSAAASAPTCCGRFQWVA